MTDSVYFILEPVEIIATDLALCLQDHDLGATVLVADGADAALKAVNLQAFVTMAFIHADPEAFHTSPLGEALAIRGAHCVFMGDRAERTMSPIRVLERPFSADAVLSIIQSATSNFGA